jgi:hypothetical protein
MVHDVEKHGAQGSGRAGVLVAGATAIAAVAAFFLLAQDPAHSAVRARAKDPRASWLTVACAQQPSKPGAVPLCPRTSTLRLGIEPMAGKQSLALAMLDPDGLLSWSFPDESGQSAKLDDKNFAVVEIPLDAGMTPGPYKVFALRTPTPLARVSVRKRLDDALAGGAAAMDADLVMVRVVVTP